MNRNNPLRGRTRLKACEQGRRFPRYLPSRALPYAIKRPPLREEAGHD